MLDPITRAYAEQRFFLLKLRLVLFAIMAAVFAAGIVRLGLVGTIAVVVAVQVAGTIGAAVRLGHVMHLRRADFAPFAVLGRIAAASAAAGLIAAAVRWLMLPGPPLPVLIACGLFYGGAYGAALLAARVIDRDDWAVVRELFDRGRARRLSLQRF